MSKGGCINRGRKNQRKFPRANPLVLGVIERRNAAEARRLARAELHPLAQLAELDKRLGKGVGAKRERARLAKLLGKAAA